MSVRCQPKGKLYQDLKTPLCVVLEGIDKHRILSFNLEDLLDLDHSEGVTAPERLKCLRLQQSVRTEETFRKKRPKKFKTSPVTTDFLVYNELDN